jgi:hypothetical protein
MITKLYVTRNDDATSFCYKSYNNIGCDDDDEEEVDSDDNYYLSDLKSECNNGTKLL